MILNSIFCSFQVRILIQKGIRDDKVLKRRKKNGKLQIRCNLRELI